MYPPVDPQTIFGPMLLVVAVWVTIAAIRRNFLWAKQKRAAYYSLPPSERAVVIKSILFMLRHGKNSTYAVADILDLNSFTTDEALRRLEHHGYVAGDNHTGTLSRYGWVELTTQGHAFYDGYYGTSGDTFYVAPWGTVVNRSALVGSEVATRTVDVANPNPWPPGQA